MKQKEFQKIKSLQLLQSRLPAQLNNLAETMHNYATSLFNNGASTYDLEYTVWDDGDYRLRMTEPIPGDSERMNLLRYKGSDGVIMYKEVTVIEVGFEDYTNEQLLDDSPDAPKRLFDGYEGEDVGRSPL